MFNAYYIHYIIYKIEDFDCYTYTLWGVVYDSFNKLIYTYNHINT